MRRRAFIALLAAVAAWPLAGVAQAPDRPWRIGFMSPRPNHPEVFRQGLKEAGLVEGRDVVLEVGTQETRQFASSAAELVAREVDVIVAVGSQAVSAAQKATRRVPIVMAASSDPVGTGFVASLAHPGGNITGLSLLIPELSAKRLQLLREIAPALVAIAVLWNPDDPPAAISLKETTEAAKAMAVDVRAGEIRRAGDVDDAFAAAASPRAGAVVILPSPVTDMVAARIAALAERARLPSIYFNRTFPDAGGLMSYGPDVDNLIRRSAIFVDKIRKGAKPADLPVEQPTKFNLVVNLRTATALGLTIPPAILAGADAVIE